MATSSKAISLKRPRSRSTLSSLQIASLQWGQSCWCFAWVRVGLALVLGRRAVASASASGHSVRYVMALRVVGLTVFVRRVRSTRGTGPGRSELFQDAELFGCQWCLVCVGRVEELNGWC